MKKFISLFILFLIVGIGFSDSAPPVRSDNYVSDTVIDPAAVTRNEDAIFTYLQAGVDTLANNTVTSLKIVDNTIESADIKTGTIVNSDISSSAAIDISKISVSNQTQGDVLFFNGTSWARLVAGTSGLFLKTQGSSANPTWATLDLSSPGAIGSTTPSTGAFTSISVTSSTKVTNLNADFLDGSQASITTGSGVIPIADGSGYLPNDSVDTTALKTATGEVSRSASGFELLLPAGGTYGFNYQYKKSATGDGYIHPGVGSDGSNRADSLSTSYQQTIDVNRAVGTLYAQTRYVTASGVDWFIYLKVNKLTGEIDSLYSAPDHVSYGNGGDYEKMPHPFVSVDLSKYEIVLLDKGTIKQLQAESTDIDEETGTPRLAALINENYKVNLTKKEPYISLHSGKYKRRLENGKEVVTKHMIDTIPDYISVRKLIKLTQAEKDTREVLREAHRIANEEKKEEKKQNRFSGINKLKALGLSKEEVIALIGE